MSLSNDPVSASSAPPRPRWVRVADVLTVLFVGAAVQAAVFGGFQMPGLSIRNPWRPLVLALIVGGLRFCLADRASFQQRIRDFRRRVERAPEPDDRAADAPRRPRMDTVFVRTFDLLAVWVISVSYVSVALLALDAYDAAVSVIVGAILTTVFRFFTPARFTPAPFDAEGAAPGRPIFPILLLVLLTALLFRVEPFRTMHGGQDQGLYVGMSSYLQREGSVFIDDPLPEALPDERSREIYRAGLQPDPPFGASVQPGVYYSHTRGDYVFQFYHLHSLWMAAFAELFGDEARFRALTFFGLLSVLGLCLLTFELTGSRPAVLAVGLLLAVNPLHVYFSRFPVTEVVALGFSSVGFYYLARAFRVMRDAAPAGAVNSLLAIAAASVSLVFFVRITGFLYMPALVPLCGLGVWLTLEHRRGDGGRIVGFCAAVAALYGLSVLYGLRYSPVYALSVYERTFGNLLGAHWPLITVGAAGATAAALAVAARNPQSPAVRRLLTRGAGTRPWTWLGTALVALAVFGSLGRAYLIGFTDRHADDAFVAQFGIVGAGAGIFLQSGAAAWLMYASPLLVVVLVRGMHRPGRTAAEVLLYVFLAVCLVATIVPHVPVIYRHYYYARYLLSEIAPYSIVLAVALISRAGPGAFRRLGVLAVLAAIPFHLYFTAKQMPVRHGARPYEVLSRIAERVDEGVLLLNRDGWGGRRVHARLQTPLSLYFGTRVFPYAEKDLDTIVQSFEGTRGTGLWLLTDTLDDHPGLRLSETFPYRDHRMDRAGTIPTTINESYWSQTLFLYRQREVCAGPDCPLRLRDGVLYSAGRGYVYHERMLGPGWYGPEERFVWSASQAAITLSRGWFPVGEWPSAVRLEMQAFAATQDHRVTVTARSDGPGGADRVIQFDDVETAVHETPLACPIDRDVCTVLLEVDGARSPREVYGSSDDGRMLGIALYRIGFRF